MSGWIKVSRHERDLDPLADKKYSRHEAWLDLVSLANWEPKTWITKKGPIEIARGCFITSIDSLSNRWRWSKSTVRRYLKAAHECSRIRRESGAEWTLIEILDYQRYQATIETVDRKPSPKRRTCDAATVTHLTAQPDPTKEIIIKKEEIRNNIKNPPYPPKGELFCKDDWPDETFEKPAFHKPELDPALKDWVDYRREIKKPIKSKTIEAIQKQFHGRMEDLRAAVDHSIKNAYQGLFEPKPDTPRKSTSPPATSMTHRFEATLAESLRIVRERERGNGPFIDI